MTRVRPEMLERWCSDKTSTVRHLYESGPNNQPKTACGLVLGRGSFVRVLRSHWPDDACADCVAIVKQTTTRVRYRDARMPPDELDAFVDALLAANR